MRTVPRFAAIFAAMILALAPAWGQAAVESGGNKLPVTGGFISAACPAEEGGFEPMAITDGFVSFRYHTVTDGAGDIKRVSKALWVLTAVGTATGATYKLNQTDMFVFRDGEGLELDYTDVGHLALHRLGPGGATAGHASLAYNLVVSKNSDGTVDLRANNFRLTCW